MPGYNEGSFLSLPAATAASLIKVGRPGNLPTAALVSPESRQILSGTVPGEEGVRLRDVFQLLVVILSIPFVILAFGMPIVLAVQLLLWIGRLF